METTLHRQLKQRYAPDPATHEVWIGDFRVDAFHEGCVIEIQQSPLSALRKKVRALLVDFPVLVVKPLACNKTIYRWDKRQTRVESCRRSPRHETLLNLFDDLVHFVDVFPQPGLCLDVVIAELEEDRVPAVKRRYRSKDYRVVDRRIVEVRQQLSLQTAADLLTLLPQLPPEFTTSELADLAQTPRWQAQKIAYCLRKTGAVAVLGKRKHAWLYALPPQIEASKKPATPRRKPA